jgi:hypothetical protein
MPDAHTQQVGGGTIAADDASHLLQAAARNDRSRAVSRSAARDAHEHFLRRAWFGRRRRGFQRLLRGAGTGEAFQESSKAFAPLFRYAPEGE